MIKVHIEPNAGFCFGVKRAIDAIEDRLKSNPAQTLHCLGELVHNHEEVTRLEALGMKTIDHSNLDSLEKSTVVIRAHGEPPETFSRLNKSSQTVIDLTCPVVRKLQERIRDAYRSAPDSQIVIIGKVGHPEVVGLNGQTDNHAIIISSPEEVDRLIDPDKPVILFAQTTIAQSLYDQVVERIKSQSRNRQLLFHNTLCRRVSNRESELRQFARQHQVVVFVSGRNSSNGNYLYSLAKAENPHTHFVSSPEEVQKEWFTDGIEVGVSGATSTPQWLLEKVAQTIQSFFP
ncbi:MAG TPA: 4-hydroxy-3-methylbut-2-enyl diphosphate reductase [Salinivirgaceae bacterium]|nr:4-hydroxy-3-methylbut-2-enyl diphosphate reductase [Salinivirgaceae bacterium]